jgi:hypothetical protein
VKNALTSLKIFVGTVHSSIFFTLPKNTTKQLKLRNPLGGLILMPKLASERKVYSMHKIINLSFIPRV